MSYLTIDDYQKAKVIQYTELISKAWLECQKTNCLTNNKVKEITFLEILNCIIIRIFIFKTIKTIRNSFS